MYHPEFQKVQNPKGVYIMFEDAPFLKRACFSLKKYNYFKEKDYDDKPLTKYGKSVYLFIQSYKLSDPSKNYHNYGAFKITVFSVKTKEAVSEEIVYEQDSKFDSKSFITTTRAEIFINEDWREKVGHTEGELESYYAEILPVMMENKNTVSSLNKDLVKKKKEEGKSKSIEVEVIEAPNNQMVLVSYSKSDDYFFTDSKTNKNKKEKSEYTETTLKKFTTEHFFKVSYRKTDEILVARNQKVADQMVSINDIDHSCIPNDYSCKFTDIEITEPGRVETLAVLSESDTGTIKDYTSKLIGIVAKGDSKKKVTITLKNLTHSGSENPVECLEIGRLHDNSKTVFGLTDELARSQSLAENDVTIGVDYADLHLKYFYNKAFNSQMQEWLKTKGAIGKWASEFIDHLWIYKYFLLREEQAQVYFLPISTCRYPSQKVMLNVYPQINWVVTFSLGLTDDTYELDWRKDLSDEKKKLIEDKKATIKKGQDYLKPFDIKKPLSTEEKEKEELLNKYNLSLSLKASYDTTTVNFTPSFKGKVTEVILKILQAKQFIDEITGNSKTEDEQKELYKKRKKELGDKFKKKRWFKKLSVLPITIKVENPKFSTGFAWGREALPTTTGFGAPISYNIFVKADPLFQISGSLDLITCAEFIPVAGQVIKVANIILEATGVEPILSITATGKIALSGTGTIHMGENTNNSKIDINTEASLMFVVEASITVDGGFMGFVISGGEVEGFVTKKKYVAKAETGFTLNSGYGVHFAKGPYLKNSIDFSGMKIIAKEETSMDDLGGNSEEVFEYVLMEPKKSLVGGINYICD
ncbi:hypothetical protein NQT66_15970 [Cellulophaga baltica]|nr:hypothetical protein [Cellulophaga baltica]